MGVKGLWPLLESVGVSCPLSELADRTVAVDLAGWVVEAESSIALANTVSRPYLRNLVYRTSALLLQHTVPVFVLDGAAPALKADELARRQGRPPASTQRHQLRGRLRRCARLLDTLGVPHVTADGEAEALCARLDAARLVDGVVSDDGDAALHGARTLYRQLSAGKTGGQVTRYDLGQVEAELGLGAVQLLDLALLLGCDYLPDGLPGVGSQTAGQLVRQLAGRRLLAELPRWLSEPPLSELRTVGELGRMSGHCATCRHPGTALRHRKAGCDECGVPSGCLPRPDSAPCVCSWHRERALADRHAAELRVRDCARRAPDYLPRAAAAAAELARVPPLPAAGDLTWRRPDLDAFATEAGRELRWAPAHCCELVAPLLARWQLRHGRAEAAPALRPLAVLRASRRHHVDCYLVSWRLQVSPAGAGVDVATHEPRALLQAAHPELVDAYLQTKKPRKPAARRPRKPASDNSGESIHTRQITDFFPTRKNAAKKSVPPGVAVAEAGKGPAAGSASKGGDPDRSCRPGHSGVDKSDAAVSDRSGGADDSGDSIRSGAAGRPGGLDRTVRSSSDRLPRAPLDQSVESGLDRSGDLDHASGLNQSAGSDPNPTNGRTRREKRPDMAGTRDASAAGAGESDWDSRVGDVAARRTDVTGHSLVDHRAPVSAGCGAPDRDDSSDGDCDGSDVDPDDEVADLSVIIDAIIRTRISDDAVIVISDDEDICRTDQTLAVAAAPGGGRLMAEADAFVTNAPVAAVVSTSDSDDGGEQYVPLCQRLAVGR